MATEHRMTFILALQDQVTQQLQRQGLSPKFIENCFNKWHAGEEAQTPWEMAAFDVFRTVQKNVEAQP
jgi:flagellar biosynthesis chaperone FliJ